MRQLCYIIHAIFFLFDGVKWVTADYASEITHDLINCVHFKITRVEFGQIQRPCLLLLDLITSASSSWHFSETNDLKPITLEKGNGQKLVGLLHETGSDDVVVLGHGFRSSKVSSLAASFFMQGCTTDLFFLFFYLI